MIDFHSHILPGIDDGSASVKESVGLLNMLAKQGVTEVAATPHFDPSCHTVERFLARRTDACGRLLPKLSPEYPKIHLGAEVLYYPGIHRLEGLEKLCLSGTNLLLLEMPTMPWDRYTVNELEDLAGNGEFLLVMAHMERYFSHQPKEVWNDLLENEVYMQANAEFFLNRKTRRRAFQLLRDDAIHLLGSDCHNTTGRPPRIGEAVSLIKKKLGSEYIGKMDTFGRSVLENIR